MFTLTISTDNAAFEEAQTPEVEIRLVLERVIRAFYDGARDGPCRDSNGNTVGRWSLTDDEAAASPPLTVEGRRIMRGGQYMFALVRGQHGDGAPTSAELDACAAELAAKVNGDGQ